MKTLTDTLLFSALVFAAVLGSHPVQAAESEAVTKPVMDYREIIIHSTTTPLSVELNKRTVLCSVADYSLPMLKVLIPALSDITLLDHQNSGAAAPCVTTGEMCRSFSNKPLASPADILQGRPGVEQIEVTVTEKRIDAINHKDKTCAIQLVETVETNIRGKKLFHERRNPLESRIYQRCANGGL